MKKMLKYSLVSVAAASLFVGCGGGGSSDSSSNDNNEAASYSLAGKAAEGYIAYATVCFDMNVNLACDASEPSTVTDENGSYSLSISAAQKDAAQKDASIIVKDGVDIDTNARLVGVLEVPFEGSSAKANISPLTTVATSMLKNGTATSAESAYDKVAKSFGLTPTEVQEDPVALAVENNNTKPLEASMILYRTAVALSEATGVEPQEVFAHVGKGLSSVGEDANASLGDIIAQAISAAPDAPEKLKEVAKVAPVIASGVEKAFKEHGESIKDAALIADATVEAAKEELHIALENNETIDDSFMENLQSNIEDAASKDPREIAIANLLSAYGIEATQAQVESLAKLFESSSDITLASVAGLSDVPASVASIVRALGDAAKTEAIKHYLAEAGVSVDTETAKEIAQKVSDFTPSMSVAAFAEKLYATNVPELMTLALKINPPSDVASLDDITKAKNLFESVRTQVNQAKSFVEDEAQNIDRALSDVEGDVEFTSLVLGHLSDMIAGGMDSGATTLTDAVADGKRVITLSKTSGSGTISWNYTIEDQDSTNSWSGTLTFPDVDPETFDPSAFTTLRVTLSGTLPVTYYGESLPEGKVNEQSVSLHAELTKTSEGAHFKLDENLTNNGNSIAVTDANAAIAYDVNATTKEPNINYVKVENLYVNGSVGEYVLDGKIDVDYSQNSLWAANDFEKEYVYSGFGAEVTCDGDVTASIDPTHVTLTLEGHTYQPAGWVDSNSLYYDNYDDKTRFWIGYNDLPAEINEGLFIGENNTSLVDLDLYGGLSECQNPTIEVHDTWGWSDDEMYNSGWLPSKINFSGKLSNSETGAYLLADINATWSDVARANIDAENYEPVVDVRAVGKLSMPESPVMTVDTHFTNSPSGRDVEVTYVNGDVSITANTSMSVTDESATVNLESTAGVKAVIYVDSEGNVDFDRSKVTDTAGNLIGKFEDRSGAPVVTYADGTFESLF